LAQGASVLAIVCVAGIQEVSYCISLSSFLEHACVPPHAWLCDWLGRCEKG